MLKVLVKNEDYDNQLWTVFFKDLGHLFNSHSKANRQELMLLQPFLKVEQDTDIAAFNPTKAASINAENKYL